MEENTVGTSALEKERFTELHVGGRGEGGMREGKR